MSFIFSPMLSDFDKDRSALTYPGPRTFPNPELPSLRDPGVVKQLVSNHLLTDPNVRTEAQVTSALFVTPLFRTSKAALILRGWPDCKTVIVLSCQPPTTSCAGREAAESHRCPLPNGSW